MGPAKPRAIFIAPVIPARTGMGLAMRAASQLSGMMQAFEVTVLVVPLIDTGLSAARFRAEFPGADLHLLNASGQEDAYFRLIAAMADPEERLRHFARYGKPSLAAGVTAHLARQVADAITRVRPELLHVFRSYLVEALDQAPEGIPRSIDLDEDDASSFHSTAAIMKRRGDVTGARFAMLEAKAFDRLMAARLKGFRAVTLANPEDMAPLLARHPGLPLRAIANCVDMPKRGSPAPERQRDGLLFVGSLGYWPNIDGLEWFITRVLPRLPGVRLRIAGRNPPRRLRALARPGRVEFLGYVEDLATAYGRASLAIAPMRSGGGTRLKILEAAAHGLPVVATSEAAAGLWTDARPWGRIADEPSRFAAACRFLLAHPRAARHLGLGGRHAVASRFARGRIDAEWARLFRTLHHGDRA